MATVGRTETDISRGRVATDWAVWLPKAFFLKWSDPKSWERNMSDTTIWLPLGVFPPEERERIVNNYYIQGDAIGIGVKGSGNVIGKNLVVGDRTISVSEEQLREMSPKYASALKSFSENVNQQLRTRQIPEDQAREINDSLGLLAKAVEELKDGENLSSSTKRILNSKVTDVANKVLEILPAKAKVQSTFGPLSLFNDIIGEPVDKVVADLIG
jgi:hypothetical protein